MSGQTGSLAEVLRLPEEAQDAQRVGLGDMNGHSTDLGSHQGVTSSDSHILTYLEGLYPPPEPSTNDKHGYASSKRSLSPPNTNINIDPALASLAHIASTSRAEYTTPHQENYHLPTSYGGLGEMGGKRKKAPHERAGWNEMQGDPGPKKRGRKKASELPLNAEASGSGGEGLEGAGVDVTAADSKNARSEQNRKAQQAFRRRREERMKELEAAAAALGAMQEQYFEAEQKLREKTLEVEAKTIENAALRTALKMASATSTVSILNARGSLAVASDAVESSGPDDPRAVEAALESLAVQSRELAKQLTTRTHQGDSTGQDRS